jgi:hypothetical protein
MVDRVDDALLAGELDRQVGDGEELCRASPKLRDG